MSSASKSRMKQSNTQRNRSFSTGGEWHGFINVHLTEDFKKQAAEWYGPWENVYKAVDSAVLAGYRITLKADEVQGTYSAFMTHTEKEHPDFGWGLSERAGDWMKALCRIMYIHHVCLQGDWSTGKQFSFVDEDW